MSRIAIVSEAQWHELRKSHVGASDVAALFDCGFQTHFQLWHEKRGTLAREDLTDNERVVLGRCLEGGIALAAQELYNFSLVKADCYVTDDATPGLASTPDYFTQRDGVEIPVEVKNASWGQWRDHWEIHDDGTVEPPLRYLLQVQTQLACTGANRGMLIALISGDRIVKCDIERHDDAIAEIRQRVTAFWASIAADEEPTPDPHRDFTAMKSVWEAGNHSADLSGEPVLEDDLKELAILRDSKRRFEYDIDLIEARVLTYCVNRQLANVRCNAGRISIKQRAAKGERTVVYKPQPSKIEMRITTAKGAE